MAPTTFTRLGRAGWAVAVAALLAGGERAPAATVADAGALRAEVSRSPWSLTLVDDRGRTVLAEHPATGPTVTGTLGFRSASVWQHATRVISFRLNRRAYVAELATSDPAHTIDLRLEVVGGGVVGLDAVVRGSGGEPVEALGIGFEPHAGESYLGFGERSNAVDQRGNVVENYVADGPYQAGEYPLLEVFVPPWGLRPREDATYYPVPWLLSSSG